MNDNTIKTGRLGERIAREYLENKGYRIIEQNYRTKYSEIDLICEKDDELVFVEVRTKTSERFGLPEETINKDKIKRLIRASQAYVFRKKWKNMYRIDAVCLILNQNNTAERIEHYQNIS